MEEYPNITWEEESKKVLIAGEWNSGGVSMMRAFEAELQLMEKAIKEGADPLEKIAVARDWLAKCLYSANSNNFKSK